MNRLKAMFGVVAVLLVIVLMFAAFEVVPAGHVKVGTLFGKVDQTPLGEGFHVVNPLKAWHAYDCRQRTHKEEDVPVPSRDQLTTTFDVSVQWRVDSAMAPTMMRESGDAQRAFETHVLPKLRSLLREEGKTVTKAEEFFQEEVVTRMQLGMTQNLKAFCLPKGIIIGDVLLRDTRLPNFIIEAIQSKKQREQEAERQKAELDRYRTEQQQKIALAEAEKQAAEMEAHRRRTLADAQAYEIERINKAASGSPVYVQLKALETLALMAKDPAAKLYFIDTKGQYPLPLLHMGDGLQQAPPQAVPQ